MVSSKSVIQRLASLGLLPNLLRLESEMQFVESYKLPEDCFNKTDKDIIKELMNTFRLQDEEALNQWKHDRRFDQDNTFFFKYAYYLSKKKYVIKDLISDSGESLFLKYKDRLDRVLYRLVRVDSLDFAFHLFYEIESGDLEIGEAAATFSEGPESKTQGIVGPVDLTTPHPEISARLKTATPGQIFEPFKADDWNVIVKLEYRFESEYDDATKDFLGGLVLSAKSNELIPSINSKYDNEV